MRRLSGWLRLGVVAAGVGFAGASMAAEAPLVDADGSVMVTPSKAGTTKAAKAAAAGPQEAEASSFNEAVKDYLGTVHGEVTAMVDSEGGYSVSGTAVLPLGENGVAVVTLGKGRSAAPWWAYPTDPLAPYAALPRPPYHLR